MSSTFSGMDINFEHELFVMQARQMISRTSCLSREGNNKEDFSSLVRQLMEKRIPVKEVIFQIITAATIVLSREPNCLYLEDPIAIIGDLHGQFDDLLYILNLLEHEKNMRILFLGDYVDRGTNSLEVMLTLLALKVTHPDRIFLLRGNHETRYATQIYGFRQELIERLVGEDVYQSFMHVFDMLPLAAVVNKNFFCVHGGISPHLTKIEHLQFLERKSEPPTGRGLVSDLLWSDPNVNFFANNANWEFNQERKCSYLYGIQQVQNFLNTNNLWTIFRAHQPVEQGFQELKCAGSAFPQVCTIFSAPAYYGGQNLAAFVVMKNNQWSYHQFSQSRVPRCLVIKSSCSPPDCLPNVEQKKAADVNQNYQLSPPQVKGERVIILMNVSGRRLF